MRRIVPAALVLLALVPQACQRDEATAPQLPRPRAQAAAGSECANPPPGTIWCDDFEVDRLSSYFEHLSPSSFARTAGVGLDGSSGMKAVYTPGVAQAGDLKVAFGRSPDPAYVTPVDGGTSDYRDIYWRAYLKNQAGWTGGGAGAFTKAMVLASPDWAQAAVGYVVAPGFGDALRLDPVSGTDADGNLLTTGYNDFDHFTWLGNATGATPIFGEAAVGQWYCIEAHMRLNDAGQSNGILEYWINGTLDAQRTGLNFLGSYSAFGINAIFFENYWSATAPQPEERYWDNIVVATQRIGCGPSGPPPPTFTTVSVGVNACALTDGGAAYCWGEGGNNGDGTTTCRPTPVPVGGGHRRAELQHGKRWQLQQHVWCDHERRGVLLGLRLGGDAVSPQQRRQLHVDQYRMDPRVRRGHERRRVLLGREHRRRAGALFGRERSGGGRAQLEGDRCWEAMDLRRDDGRSPLLLGQHHDGAHYGAGTSSPVSVP